MPITFVGAADLGNNGGSGNLSVSYSCSSGSNRLLTVAVVGDTSNNDAIGTNVSGATYNGVAMTLVAKMITAGSGGRWAYLFYLLNPDAGSNSVVVSTSSGYAIACAADYSGVAQLGQPDASATAASGMPASTASSSITTVADQCWTVMVSSGYDGGDPPTAGTGSTRRQYDHAFGAVGLFDSGADVTPAGSFSMAMAYASPSSQGIAVVQASFSPAGGGGGISGTFYNQNGPGTITLTGAAETVNVVNGRGTVTVTGSAGTFNADNGRGKFIVS